MENQTKDPYVVVQFPLHGEAAIRFNNTVARLQQEDRIGTRPNRATAKYIILNWLDTHPEYASYESEEKSMSAAA